MLKLKISKGKKIAWWVFCFLEGTSVLSVAGAQQFRRQTFRSPFDLVNCHIASLRVGAWERAEHGTGVGGSRWFTRTEVPGLKPDSRDASLIASEPHKSSRLYLGLSPSLRRFPRRLPSFFSSFFFPFRRTPPVSHLRPCSSLLRLVLPHPIQLPAFYS